MMIEVFQICFLYELFVLYIEIVYVEMLRDVSIVYKIDLSL